MISQGRVSMYVKPLVGKKMLILYNSCHFKQCHHGAKSSYQLIYDKINWISYERVEVTM